MVKGGVLSRLWTQTAFAFSFSIIHSTLLVKFKVCSHPVTLKGLTQACQTTLSSGEGVGIVCEWEECHIAIGLIQVQMYFFSIKRIFCQFRTVRSLYSQMLQGQR